MLSKLKTAAAHKVSYFKNYKKNDAKVSLLEEENEAMSNIRNAWHSSHMDMINTDFLTDSSIGSNILSQKWTETSFNNAEPVFNKIFSAEWLSNEQILFGTKDNKLMYYNTKLTNMNEIDIPLPDIVNKYNTVNDANHPFYKYTNKGVHCVTSNDEKKYVLANGYYTNDITLYKVNENAPSHKLLTPITILKNHKGWVTSIKWLNYDRFISTSYDGTISIWSLSNIINTHEREGSNNIPELCNYKVYNTNPLDKKNPNRKIETTIRTMDIHSYNKCNVTLSSDGYVNIFDTHNDNKEIFNKLLPYRTGCVKLSINDNKNLVSIASFEYLQLFDPRNYNNSYTLKKSLDNKKLGIRNLEWLNDNILSISGGNNLIYFYDIRNNKYLDNIQGSGQHNKSDSLNYIQCKKGAIKKTRTYNQSRACGSNLPNCESIFVHKFSPNKDKFFCGGGPTHASFYGNNMSIFEKP